MPRGILRLRKENIKSLNQEQEKKRQRMYLPGLKETDHIKVRVVKILQNACVMSILVKVIIVQKDKVIIVK